MKKDVAVLLLRLAGLGLAIGHGWGKIAGLATGESDGLIAGIGSLGFPMPGLFAWAAALAEFGGALCVAFGLGTRFAAAVGGFTLLARKLARPPSREDLKNRDLQNGPSVICGLSARAASWSVIRNP